MKDIELKELPESFELREVQKDALELIRGEIRNGNKRIITHIATGGGKTILAGMIFYLTFQKHPAGQCWFVVNRNVLLEQTKETFETLFGFDCSIVQGDTVPNLKSHVQLATIQTLHNRLNSKHDFVRTSFENCPVKLAIIDEAHLSFKGYESVAESWGSLMIGLTATPFSKGMGRFWDSMVRPRSMVELIKDGTLCDYKVKACVAIDRSKLSTTSTGEYKDSDVERETGAIIGDVYKEWAEDEECRGRPFLGFVKNISTCVALSELFSSHGVRVAYVHSKMADDVVQATLDSFKAGHYDGVFSVVKLIEGFDFPAATVGLMCTPFAPSKADLNIPNSANRYVQSAGRLLRSHESKEIAIFHDHAGNFERYGPYELIEELFVELDNSEKKEPVELTPEERLKRATRECSNCHMMITGGTCQYCGSKAKQTSHFVAAGDLEFVDGEMVVIKKSEATNSKKNNNLPWPEKIQFARELKGHCMQKKSKSPGMNIKGYYAHKYKARMGVWPNDSRVAFDRVPALAPSESTANWITSQNIAWAKGRKNAKS